MTRPSTKPFGESLRALMDERSLTYRGLAEATRKLDGKGITHAHINMLANGHDKPSMRAMELIAAACGVAPTTSPSTDWRRRCASSTRPKSGSSRRSRTSTPDSARDESPAPEDAHPQPPQAQPRPTG